VGLVAGKKHLNEVLIRQMVLTVRIEKHDQMTTCHFADVGLSIVPFELDIELTS
jgi:hypothetical protein